MLKISLASKANHRVGGNTVARIYPDFSFSGKSGMFKMSKSAFDSLGIADKSIAWADSLTEDGKVVVVTLEGTSDNALGYKNSARGIKGRGLTAATLVEVIQTSGLLPEVITEDTKAAFDFEPIEGGVEGALEGYYLVVSTKTKAKKADGTEIEDEDEDEAEEVVVGEEVAEAAESLEATEEGFNDEI